MLKKSYSPLDEQPEEMFFKEFITPKRHERAS